ncbi:TPA: hypothetical protein ACKOHV_003904, partial [Clostridioides difficile]
ADISSQICYKLKYIIHEFMEYFMSFKYWFKNIKKKKQIKKDIKYFNRNKESIINYQEYYTKIYNHYN